ncbi:2'-5' RNA ligase family protein [Williamsia serinedens]|uniref:2'-5' RNA ligase superfamily protein n=1 Tax=Williamsia serinedens TaxID=391736 RepID=A0ABT1H6R5_9NOCA|nr:2'-5' RNA ligase family protein [Williamsia serinedens]MCP2162432.1 2'-5' RNA ligase superfamily protein [Williamsia serinedens]
MAHSVELLPDPDTERRIRDIWDALIDAGLPSQASVSSESNRPHVTLVAARTIDDTTDPAMRGLARDRLPLPVEIGAPVVFGGRTATVALLVVPTADLLVTHSAVVETIGAAAVDPVAHSGTDGWTAHVTVARRVPFDQLSDVLRLVVDHRIDGTVHLDGMRRWDSDARTVTDLSG